MKIKHHPLSSQTPGTTRQVVSFHYGPAGGAKVYIQSSLHADEIPGMLVVHHLRRALAELENTNRLLAEFVVVPVANPIGLAQSLLRTPHGRFELDTGENFNRSYPTLIDAVWMAVKDRLTDRADHNVRIIREAIRAAVADVQPQDELGSMRKTLLALACDADVVLDLHCDSEAVIHLYTGSPLWEQAEPLARYLGAEASLLATDSGDNPFDEACSQIWWQLAEKARNAHSVPLACFSATVELRGSVDVGHDSAAEDAQAMLNFFTHRGLIAGDAPALPPLKQPATPLAGTDVITAPISGVVVFARAPGNWIAKGDVVAEVINPLTAEVCTLTSATDGLLFARESQRYAKPGMRLAKIAGNVPLRSGKLLSP